jgi:phage gpG-like protein
VIVFSSILDFVGKLERIDDEMQEASAGIIAKACEMVCTEAKHVLGTHDYNWPALKPETIARKITGDSPLLETGEMRDSIEWNADEHEGHVGSNDDKAVWQELGTSRIPPRSFLAGAAKAMEPAIHEMAAQAAMAVIEGRGLHTAEFAELIGLLRSVRP